MKHVRKCKECGEELNGRLDKVFCADQCRSTYHNRFPNEDRSIVRKTNRILRKNRSILCDLKLKGKKMIEVSILEDRGFRFGYATCIYVRKNSEVIYFCYDSAYHRVNGKKIRILDELPEIA